MFSQKDSQPGESCGFSKDIHTGINSYFVTAELPPEINHYQLKFWNWFSVRHPP